MSVKRLVCGVLLSALSLLGFQSCREKVVEVTTFQPKFEILTPSVLGGESFSFRVYSNTGSFIISRLSCGDYDGMTVFDFPFSGINLGSEVKCGDDGWVVFEAKSVKVKSNHEGSISVTLKDPKTGAVCDLEAKYKAFVAFAANGIAIGNENGIVVDGDDFTFSVETNLSYFVLEGFHCPFATDKLVRNRAYQCDKDGRVDFVIPDVKVLKAARDSIVLDIKDEATGVVIHRSAEFDMRPALTASISVADVSSDDGKIELYYSASRPNLRLESAVLEKEKRLYRTGSEEIVRLDDFGFVNEEGLKLSKGSDVKIPISNLNGDQLSGNSRFTASGIYTDEEQTVSLRLTLYDYETGRTVNAGCSFKVRPYSYPDKLKLTLPGGSTKVIDNGGGTDPIPVSYYDGTAMGRARGQISLPFTFLTCEGREIQAPYRYEISLVPSSEGNVSFTSKEDGLFATTLEGNTTGGNLYIRGGKNPGEATLVVRTVTGRDDWNRTYYIKVNVRKRVALVLNASFRQVPEWDRDHSFMFDAKSSSIDVATWDGPDDLMNLTAAQASKACLATINDGGGGLKVTLKTEAYPVTYKTKFFEGLCDIGHFKLENGKTYSPGGDIAKYGKVHSYSGNLFYYTCDGLHYGANDGGTEGRDSYSTESRGGKGKKRTTVESLTEYLNHWNDCAMWWTHDKKNKTSYEHMVTEDGYYTFLTRWKEFDISVSDIVYDKSKYDIRYVVYLWGTDMNPDTYWWGTNSSLNVSEVQGMFDIANYFYDDSISMDMAAYYVSLLNNGTELFFYSNTTSNFTGKPSAGLPSGRYSVANRVPWCQEWPE